MLYLTNLTKLQLQLRYTYVIAAFYLTQPYQPNQATATAI